jgi:mercuric ion transport protein
MGTTDNRERLFASGGLIAAILASSCCVLPVVLVTIGVSGAWIGNLTALEPYNPIFAAIAIAAIGLGFWQVYVRTPRACAAGDECSTPRSQALTKVALWVASALTLVTLTTRWWAPLFY